MLKDFLKIDGVKELDKEKLKNTTGGILTITCEFSDGGNWSGQTCQYHVASDMARHCVNSGGSPSYSNSDFE
ncbi:hypothetical protein EV195_101589 [Tenacibaculum skagerrakense]|uniref:Uncharacterized protein n=1 Tax=Tenacibaculum skagerrakense TaxID=186571 RepID=A0A4R2P3D5_9FLAO|nr:hypothetical protein [Tenacibaculum skagerrakense]TCP28411.1 hypothetical protein EV195_101589 [Tenacibaculum skagerrakense]